MKQKKSATSHILISIFAFVLLSYPGQNIIQTLNLGEKDKQVLGIIDDGEKDPLPYKVSDMSPDILAKSAIAIDVGSGVILYEKNPDIPLPPASTTKIMTAIVAFEEYKLDEVVTIRNENRSIGNTSDLVFGESLSVENLIYALLISSGNDAALALGQHHPEGYQGFVDKMNQKASELHLQNTQFSNVSGLEQSTHFTTSRDLGILSRELMKKSFLSQIVGEKTKVIQSQDGVFSHTFENTNQLLGLVDGIRGVKTGWTQLAGECLVTSVMRDDREIITVILGSDDRFGESRKLIEWAYENHIWKDFPQI